MPQELLRMQQDTEVVEVRYERTELRKYIRQQPFGKSLGIIVSMSANGAIIDLYIDDLDDKKDEEYTPEKFEGPHPIPRRDQSLVQPTAGHSSAESKPDIGGT
ncbi:MAG: hypothetical protein HETSPECPRED_005797 [Heterodermia speciosa]|uniref:Uncharacterized protein n=1 Tax=Heterodermia speciosa TaxID=116794 RepID=A0A8H3FIL2_9LECA|nr:MAG: hypothetical protein HETSPECPRED_005797 [Heterodermia speciosa]